MRPAGAEAGEAAASTRPRAPLFDAVVQTRASDDVVRQIRQRILDGTLRPGALLPPERELMCQFGVSRATVREALRALQSVGLLETRQGAGGGARVRRPGPQQLASLLEVLLQLDPGKLGELWEARQGIEVEIVALAAQRATREDVEALGDCLRRQEAALADPVVFARADVEFHLTLAAAAHNVVYQGVMQSLADPLSHAIGALALEPLMRERGCRLHREIVDAVRGGSAGAAREIMAEHFAAVAEGVALLVAQKLATRR